MSTNKKADLSKLAHLLELGRLVHTVDGGVYRVTSKVKGPDGFVFKLADLQGKPVQMPENFRPVTAGYAKFAAWQRFVVAYNRDFDLYVKEYIRSAGLPIDNEMNWAKWFQTISNSLVVPNITDYDEKEAVRDEAIHWLIIYELAELNILSRTDSAGFKQAIKRFPPEVQERPLEKQVTTFLCKSFSGRVMDANRYIKSQVFQAQTDSMWGQEEQGTQDGEEFNRLDLDGLDNLLHGRGNYDQNRALVWHDIQQFRKKFEDWLLSNRIRQATAKTYLLLYDLYWEHALSKGGGVKPADVLADWEDESGYGMDYLKTLWKKLRETLRTYIDQNREQLGDVTFWEMQIKDMGKQTDEAIAERKQVPVKSSLKIADELHHNEGEAAAGGPMHEDEGRYCRMVYLAHGDLQVEATETLKQEFAQNEDWNPDLYELLEDFTTNGWEWIRPEDIGALTSGDIIADPDGDIFWHERYQIEDPVEELRTSGHFIMQHGGSLDGSDAPQEGGSPDVDAPEVPQDKTSSDDETAAGEGLLADDFESIDQMRETEEKAMEENESETFQKVIQDVLASGLFSSTGNPHFSHSGCDNCGSREAEVEDCEGYRNLEEAEKGEDHKVEFKLCSDCIYKAEYGETN